jgi:hypothetical protein
MPLSIFTTIELDRLVPALTRHIGCTPVTEHPDTGVLHRFSAFDIEFVVFDEHGLEPDAGIDFGPYQSPINLLAFASAMGSAEFWRVYEDVAVYLAAALSKALSGKTLVVAKLQKVVATFS